jgi:hypothetical protein
MPRLAWRRWVQRAQRSARRELRRPHLCPRPQPRDRDTVTPRQIPVKSGRVSTQATPRHPHHLRSHAVGERHHEVTACLPAQLPHARTPHAVRIIQRHCGSQPLGVSSTSRSNVGRSTQAGFSASTVHPRRRVNLADPWWLLSTAHNRTEWRSNHRRKPAVHHTHHGSPRGAQPRRRGAPRLTPSPALLTRLLVR